MHLTTLALTLATATLATARLSGFAVPATIAPGSRFNLTLITKPREDSRPEVAVSYGYSTKTGYPGALGYNVQSMFLGPANSDTPGNVTILAKAPRREDLIPGNPNGPGVDEHMYLNLAFFQLGPNDAYPMISSYNVSVLFGKDTSNDLVGTTTPLDVIYS